MVGIDELAMNAFYRRNSTKLICVLLISFAFSSVFAETARIAVASNFSMPMKKIVHLFEQQTGHSISLIFGSSGKFFAQIMNGAPFDILLSADSI